MSYSPLSARYFTAAQMKPSAVHPQNRQQYFARKTTKIPGATAWDFTLLITVLLRKR
jgi:hypothetical protein